MNTNKKDKKPRAYMFLLINAILWGLAPAVIKIGLKEVSPFVYLYYRHLICAALILLYILLTGKLLKSLKIFTKPLNLITMFILTPGVLMLQFIALNITDSIIASIVTAFTPLIGNLIGGLFLKENITKKEKIGTVLAFTGIIALIVIQSKAEISFDIKNNILGIALLITASVIWIVGGILFQRIPKKDQDLVSLNSFFLSVIFFAGIFALTDPNLLVPSLPSLNASLSILYMAIFGSLIAFLAYQEGAKHVEVSESSVFTYLQPVFGIPAAVILLKQQFSPLMLIPIITIFSGMWFNVIEKFEKSEKETTYEEFIEKVRKTEEIEEALS